MPPELREQLLSVLRNHPELRIAILFGSLAKGTAKPDSDIDLAVGIGKPLSADEKMQLIEALAVAFGRPVDLIDLATVGEPLLGQILTGGVRILGSNAEYANLLKRHLFDQADFVPLQKRILKERRQRWIGT